MMLQGLRVCGSPARVPLLFWIDLGRVVGGGDGGGGLEDRPSRGFGELGKSH